MASKSGQVEPVAALVERFGRGDRRALSRLATLLIDGGGAGVLAALGPPRHRALKIGITGSAGAGKSTLAGALVRHLRRAGRSVAVLACDPTSPFTGGALLGDRLRIDHDPSDVGVFVRSVASRGSAGGLSAGAGAVVRLLECFGFDCALVETVGAGQDQLAVRDVVDVLVLVVTPGGGDEVQWQKAGVLEAADVIAVNKADLPGAGSVAAELRESLKLGPSRGRSGHAAVVEVTATTGGGVAELWDAIEASRRSSDVASRAAVAVRTADVQPGDVGTDAERGFLPQPDPLDRLPDPYAPWELIAGQLPKLLVGARLREAVDAMPLLSTDGLDDPRQIRRAMMLLSFLGHAYVWGQGSPVGRIPITLAVPWHAVAERLGRPPVLSYASYALDNWRRLDPAGPVALGNIVLLQNFLGGVDEEWFVLVHVEIEGRAAPAMAAIPPAQRAAADDRPELATHLTRIADSLSAMHATLLRMPERCDPYIYFNRVRPYIHGWKDHPALPQGLVYEGVGAYAGRPQGFRGETGAQSSIVPALDAALGIEHRGDPLRPYLAEMRAYMPPAHLAFIEVVERGPSIRRRVLDRASRDPALAEAYNACVRGLAEFRSLHLEYAAQYIFHQAQISKANPAAVGTGGTPFMPYLAGHRDETLEHQVRP